MFRMAALMAVAGVVSVAGASASPGRYAPGRIEQVRTLAHEVEEAAERVRDEATGRSRWLTPADRRALRRLDVLVFRARQFHREVERPRLFPERLDEDFLALEQAHWRAAESLRWLRAHGQLRREFERLSFTMNRLTDRYERLIHARHGRPREHDDRYDRHDLHDDDHDGPRVGRR